MVIQFGLSADMSGCEVGPRDCFSVNLFIYNDATEDMYVFIEIEMPLVWTSPLYSFIPSDDWCLVESDGGVVVYACATALTEQMTIRQITNAEYVGIDDINITLTGFAIGAEGVHTVPVEA